MISFTLSPEQEEIVGLARRIAEKEFRAKAFEWRKTGEIPHRNLEILRDAGLLGLTVDPKYGGQGLTAIDSILVTETISSICPVTGSYANSCDLGPTGFINVLGSEQQKEWLLPKLVRGEWLPGIGLTEPEAGSALIDLRTTGKLEGDQIVVNGQKIYTSNADKANVFFVYVQTGKSTKDIRCVIIERDTKGFSIGPKNQHMSGETWAPLYFDNCRVPAANILPTGQGFSDLITIYSMERTAAAAKMLGITRLALDIALKHAVTRKQFGKALAEFQGIQWKFADMAMKLESAQLLTYRAAANAAGGKPTRKESSMAKLAATEAATFVCDEAIQILGASGLSQEVGLEWLYRRVRGYRIAGGTSEIHRNMIAKEMIAAVG